MLRVYRMKFLVRYVSPGLAMALTLLNVNAQVPSDFSDFANRDAAAFRAWQRAQQAQGQADHSEPRGRDAVMQVIYAGTAEADGRQASLTLTFNADQVEGRLLAKGVSGPGIRLPTTEITFGPFAMKGPWESTGTSIVGAWTGGDYMDGQPIPDYPTNGTLTISIEARADGDLVRLHRIATSTYGYTFPAKGCSVYSPPANSADTNSAGTVESTGYHNPVGRWVSHRQASDTGTDNRLVFRLQLTADGAAAVSITDVATGRQSSLQGTWRRQGNGIQIQWSPSSLADAGITDDDPVQAGFSGPNRLLVQTDDSPIVFTREGIAAGNGEDADTLDISKVVGIALSYTNTVMEAGTNQPAPRVFAVMRGSGDLVPIADDKVSWTGFSGVNVEKGQVVSRGAKPGTSGSIQAEVDIGGRPRYASCRVSIVQTCRTGTADGIVWLGYFGIPLGPPRALGGEIEITGPAGTLRTTFGPDGKYRFENLEQGSYQARVVRVQLPTMQAGYESSPTAILESLKWFSIPTQASNGKWDVNVTQWWQIVEKPPRDHCVHGKVLYNGQPVAKAAVTLINNDGSSIREVESDKHGQYVIHTQGMSAGMHSLMALKMVDPYNTPPWATDDDLLDIASHSGSQQSLSVVLPVAAAGEEVDIPCDTRKQLLGTPGGPPTPSNTPETPQVP